MIYYILKNDEILTTNNVLEFEEFMRGNEHIIKQETIKTNNSEYFVSTVFLGIDHGFSFLSEKRPILFETMIFPENKKEDWEGYQRRCCTKAEALVQHEEALEFLKKYKIT